MGDQELQEELAQCQLQKVKLETTLLKWQNSRLGLLSQFTTVITMCITLLTVFAALIGWGFDRMKERALRAKELNERIENQSREDIQQLLRYPIDESQTTPSTIFIFNDLSNLLANYKPEELNKVGMLVTELIRSSEFDLGKPRNVEFDLAALRFCGYCAEAFAKNPKYTRIVLEKYAAALEPFHKDDEKFKYVSKTPGTDGSFSVNRPLGEGFTMKLRPFATMVRAYEYHLGLLNKSMQEDSKNADMLKKEIEKATCDFYMGTQNPTLSKNVFNIDDGELSLRLKQCLQ